MQVFGVMMETYALLVIQMYSDYVVILAPQYTSRTPTTRMTPVLMTMTFIIKIAQDNPCSPYLVSGSCPLSGSRHQNVGLLLQSELSRSEKLGTQLIFLLTILSQRNVAIVLVIAFPTT